MFGRPRLDIRALFENGPRLGNVLVQLGRDNEALLSYQHALKLDPRDFDAASKRISPIPRRLLSASI